MRRAPLWALLLQVAASTAVAQVPYLRIARPGDPAPGAPGTTIDFAAGVGIDAQGRVAFNGSVDGPGIDGANDGRIWYGYPENLQVVAAEGPAPRFGEGVRLLLSPNPGLSATGQVTFRASLFGGDITEDNRILLAGDPAAPEIALRSGSPPPGIENELHLGLFSGFNSPGPYISASGSLVFPGDNEVQGRALWAGLPGDLRLVARTGAPAPGTNVSFISGTLLLPTYTQNERGAVAFPAFLEGPGVTGANNAGLWAGTAADLSLIMRAGQPAPGTEPGVNYIGRPSAAVINANDRVLFPSFLTGPGINGSNDFGLWMSRAGQLPEPVVREGEPVPALGDDFTIIEISQFFSTDDNRVAMVQRFTGPGVTSENDQLLLFGDIGNLEIVIRDGDPLPGLPAGVVVDMEELPFMAFRESGAGAMRLGLRGPGVDASNDRALFYRSSESMPWAFVAREGASFDGGLITDGGISFWGGGGGYGGSQALNDDGLFAFTARFEEEGAGVYLVPDPSAFVLLILGFLGAKMRRQDRVTGAA